jgi:hypothetical protein
LLPLQQKTLFDPVNLDDSGLRTIFLNGFSQIYPCIPGCKNINPARRFLNLRRLFG